MPKSAAATKPTTPAGEDRNAGQPVQRTVPAAGAAPLATTGASSPFALGRAAGQSAAANRTKRGPLPGLLLDTLVVEKNVPLPPRLRQAGVTKYDALFNRLQADGDCMLNIPRVYKASLVKALDVYLKHRPQLAATSTLLVRTMPNGQGIGVWRQAKAAKAGPA